MVDKKQVPKDFYDVQKLFPSQIATFYKPTFDPRKTRLSPENQIWLSKSKGTVAAVGLLSKFWLTCKSINFWLEFYLVFVFMYQSSEANRASIIVFVGVVVALSVPLLEKLVKPVLIFLNWFDVELLLDTLSPNQ